MVKTMKEYREMTRRAAKSWREKHKDDPEYKKKNSDRWKKWYAKKKKERAEMEKEKSTK